MNAWPLVAPESRAGFVVQSDVLRIDTKARLQFVDLTEAVLDRVERSGVQHGLVTVQTRHTTTAIVVNEKEPLLLRDMEAVLERLAPGCAVYGHNDLRARTDVAPDESENGDAHCRAMLMGTAETLIVAASRVQLGTWQRIFLVELDGPRTRSVGVMVMGLGRAGEGEVS
jgi:secondary thiamine-phosphate synthase enzyme